VEEFKKFSNWLVLIGVIPGGLSGLAIMALYGSPPAMLLMNFGAMVLGFVSGPWVSSAMISGAKRRSSIIAGAILILLTLTFFDAGLDGVHRWLRLGPLRLHPSALSLPLFLLQLVFLLAERRWIAMLVIFGLAMAVHVAQPDAGQATALAAAGLVIAAFRDQPLWSRIALVGMGILGAAATWLRPDPLLGIPMVEDIVPEAFAMHAGLGIAAVVALALLPMSAFAFARRFEPLHTGRVYGFALGVYFLASFVAVGVGEFPTPVLGFGASPMLGAIWGLALLWQMERAPAST
jgi:cell division protein FtsW (lipid II flippase)